MTAGYSGCDACRYIRGLLAGDGAECARYASGSADAVFEGEVLRLKELHQLLQLRRIAAADLASIADAALACAVRRRRPHETGAVHSALGAAGTPGVVVRLADPTARQLLDDVMAAANAAMPGAATAAAEGSGSGGGGGGGAGTPELSPGGDVASAAAAAARRAAAVIECLVACDAAGGVCEAIVDALCTLSRGRFSAADAIRALSRCMLAAAPAVVVVPVGARLLECCDGSTPYDAGWYGEELFVACAGEVR